MQICDFIGFAGYFHKRNNLNYILQLSYIFKYKIIYNEFFELLLNFYYIKYIILKYYILFYLKFLFIKIVYIINYK